MLPSSTSTDRQRARLKDARSPGEAALRVFVLAKDEEANIKRCLDSCRHLGVEVVVLDSGSADRTVELAAAYPFVRVERFKYVNHCRAYNELSFRRTPADAYCMVLDADMVLTEDLSAEIGGLIRDPVVQVIRAPVAMYWEGRPLRHGSLYPPKPFLFRGGMEYFVALGHGECIKHGTPVNTTKATLIHDDRKEYSAYLCSQFRYSKNLVARARVAHTSWRDRLRLASPLMVILTPLYSLFVRRGLLAGRAGLVYAMDRLIAEAVCYRQALADRLPLSEESGDVSSP